MPSQVNAAGVDSRAYRARPETPTMLVVGGGDGSAVVHKAVVRPWIAAVLDFRVVGPMK